MFAEELVLHESILRPHCQCVIGLHGKGSHLDVPDDGRLVPSCRRQSIPTVREFESPDLVRVSLQNVRSDRWEGRWVTVAVGEERDGSVGGVEHAVEALVGLGLLE